MLQVADTGLLMPGILHRFNRRVSFLVGARVLSRPMEGKLARGIGATIVRREWDRARLGTGTISVPNLQQSHIILGQGTKFDREARPGDPIMSVVAKRHILRGRIAAICGPEKLVLAGSFLDKRESPNQFSPQDLQTLKYSLISGANTHSSWEEITQALHNHGSISLFPEGTCHDQPGLLPLKSEFIG
jgi:glycerol-3-phosphate O-acyltransferase / dihydroxyacetone phosphate acyltransferase